MGVAAAEALDLRKCTVEFILEIFQIPTIVHDDVSKLPLPFERGLCGEQPAGSISRHATPQRALELLFGLAPHNHQHIVVAIGSGLHEKCCFDHGNGYAVQRT